MSRQSITDRSNPPKSEWFGFKYKVTPETSKLLQEAVFKDGGRWAGGQTHPMYLEEPFIQVTYNGKMWRGFTNFEEIKEPEKQPPQMQLPQPFQVAPQPKKEFQQGKWYRCVEKYGRNGTLIVGKYYRINELSKIESTCTLDALCFWWDLSMFDINSESDFNPDTVDPYKHTAYVKFKGLSGKYDSKEYCYKCDNLVLVPWVAVGDSEDLYASVDVSGEIKTVQIQRISKDYVDSKATKCIIGIAEHKVESKLDHIVQVTINRDDFFSKEMTDYLSVNKSGNNATTNVGDVNMTQVTRKVYSVQLIDGDAGLPVELSLVHDFKTVITEDDIETTKQQLLADIDLAKILKDHNAKRTAQVNLDIQNRTGNSVKLLPITKVKELTWSFK